MHAKTITPQDLCARLSYLFPKDEDVIDDIQSANIDEMFEDFIMRDLRAAPTHEMEALEPSFRPGDPVDMLNVDGCAMALAQIVCEDDLPVAALLFWNGSRIAIAVPEDGNLLNTQTRTALGRGPSDAPALCNHFKTLAHVPNYEGDPNDYAECWDHLWAADPSFWSAYNLEAITRWARKNLFIRQTHSNQEEHHGRPS